MDESRVEAGERYTVLLTDLEDSTRLWERHPHDMEAVVTGTFDLAARIVRAHRGHVVKSTGDGVLALFRAAADAIGAAVEIQREAAMAAFPGIGRVNLRIGLNTGPCRLVDGDVIGRAPNLASRLQDAGHGGQIVVSESTATECAAHLRPDVRLIDLGPYLIRGFDEPVGVHSVAAPGVRSAFPPLRAGMSGIDDLPPDETELFGRDGTITVVTQMIDNHRLVTLWGPGGVGKTRTAVRVAMAARRPFRDGVRFVDLSAVTGPDDVTEALVAALRVQVLAGERSIDALSRALRDARVLLVLDECERALDAVREVLDVTLSSSRSTHVIVTTREPLGVPIERTLEIRPLPVPPDDDDSLATLERIPAVQLFAARLSASVPGFSISTENAAEIAAICRATDGLPLALELAAARAGVEGLDARGTGRSDFSALTTLGEDALLYSHLAVFSGPFGRELALQIAPDSAGAEYGIARLVRTAMVQQDGHAPPAYRLLAPFRSQAWARLDDEERTAITHTHARLMLERAEAIAPEMRTDQEARVVNAWRSEFAEYRSAMAALLARDLVEEAARLVIALFPFCVFQPRPEGHRWAAAVAQRLRGDEPHAAEVLGAAALGAWFAGDTGGAIALGTRAVDVAELTGGSDHWGRLALVDALGYSGELDAVVPHFVALVDRMRDDEDPFWQVNGLGFEAIGFTMAGQADEAAKRAEQALTLARHLGNPDCVHWAFYALGRAIAASDPVGACEAFEQAIRSAREVDSQFNAGLALVEWVGLERRLGGREMAIAGALDLLDLLAVSGNRSQLSQTLREAGLLLAETGHDEAATLALLARRGLPAMPAGPDERLQVERCLDDLAARLPDTVARLRVRARALSEPEVVAMCRGELELARRELAA